jgi:uncharacterized protein (UPF0335 family)
VAQQVVGGMDASTITKLNHHVTRIEELEEERTQSSELIKDQFAVAKADGFDPKIMRIILKLRKRDTDDIDEEETLVDVYKSALGMH